MSGALYPQSKAMPFCLRKDPKFQLIEGLAQEWLA